MSISRRNIIAGAVGITGVAAAAGIASRQGWIPPDAGGIYGCGHTLTYAAQRLLTRHSNAREFARSRISKIPHPNGVAPKGDEFKRLQAGGFQDWQVTVDGMVDRPGTHSFSAFKSYPVRSQITELICEEGWSYIAEWTGTPLSHILNLAGLQPKARYAVYYSMDGWVDAIDMDDAMHDQTLVAYAMNSGEIPIPHGGPVRMRLPKQLGYKSLKFLNKVTLTSTLDGMLPPAGYSWFAGM